jgi:tetratricopeptide (TPR) repeat protein
VWSLDRDRIWRTAWLCVPLAIALNLLLGFGVERSTRLADQGLRYAEAQRWQLAAERYAAAARADPGTPLYAHNASAAYLRLGRVDEALEWNGEALRRDPTFEPALEARPKLEQRARALRAGMRDSGGSH